jgi:hypothetical protein
VPVPVERRKVRLIYRVGQRMFSLFNVWGSPTRGSFSRAWVGAKSPEGASRLERVRDRWLSGMVHFENTFLCILLTGLLALLGFGGFIVFLMVGVSFGVDLGSYSEVVDAACNISQYNQSLVLFAGDTQYPPRVLPDTEGFPSTITRYGLDVHWVAHYCTPAQWWFNICVKYFSFYFTFVNALPLPWTISTFIQAFWPAGLSKSRERLHVRREKAETGRFKDGIDFYGRPSSAIWFWIPRRRRKVITTMMLIALIVQIPDCICHVIYWSYLAIQVWPGALITNIWLGIQVSCQIAGSVLQGREEARLRKQHPGKFPPTLGTYLGEAWRRWRAEGHGLCCGRGSYLGVVREEVRRFNTDVAKFGKTTMTSGISVAEVGKKRHQLYRSAARGRSKGGGKLGMTAKQSRRLERLQSPVKLSRLRSVFKDAAAAPRSLLQLTPRDAGGAASSTSAKVAPEPMEPQRGAPAGRSRVPAPSSA